MESSITCYLPTDRLHAVAADQNLPQSSMGSALFADISGFTPVTERLRSTLGARRGVEELASHLNRVYDALIAQVDRYGGSIIGFAGDAITCWFSGEAAASRAAACGFGLLAAMRDVGQITLPEGGELLLGLKVAITSGTTKRFVVGDPSIQLIDALAGAVVARMASGEELAERGELLVDAPTAGQLGEAAKLREWRGSEPEQFAVLESFETSDIPYSTTPQTPTPPDDLLLSWLLPPLARHFQAGLGEFQIELRPVTVLFLRFSGVEYDEDADAEDKLNQFVRLVQTIVNGYEGNLLQLTIGDKGSYIYAAFGAPFAHEDDPARALDAALDIREQAKHLPYLDPVQIGVSQGTMRTGAYGGTTRRTYGVLGDEVNLAARLMARAAPGEILVSETVSTTIKSGFVHEALPPAVVKGKANPIGIFRLLERRDYTFAERFYTTPMVGRDETLATLKNALQPILQGRHAGVITIMGEPGMGKSRLAFEVQQGQQDEGNVSWFTGQADALNRAPLNTFAYFLRPYFGQQRDQDHATNLAAFDAAFEDLSGLADEANEADLTLYRSFLAGILNLVIPGSPYETADEKLRVDNSISALKAWARAEARRQPLILHLEDAQWFDPSSIRAVQQLTYNMEDVPLVLLLTSRYNDDGSPFVIPNIYSVPVHTFELAQLNEDGVRAVAAAILQGDITEGLGRFVQQRAEGNPFFTEQVMLDLKERGALTVMEGTWDIRTDAAAEVPAGVNAVLIARIDRLTAQVKAVVQTAAVLGREFDVMTLSQMLRETDMSAVREAEREAIWSSLDEIRYLFRHALLRDAAYEMQAQERLKALHRLAAETIETLHPGDDTQADILLEHWHAADEVDRELPYLNTVSHRLIEITAQYAQARSLLERGLGKLGEHDPRRAMLLNWLSAYHLRQGNFAQAAEAAEQAHLLASPHDRTILATSLSHLGFAAGRRDSYVEAQAYFEQSMALYQALNDKAGIATILYRLGEIQQRQGAYAQARANLEQSLRLRREMDKPAQIALSLTTLAVIARSQGNLSEAHMYAEESLILQREIGDKVGIANTLNQLGTFARMEGNYQAAHAYHEQALAITVEIGSRLAVANTLISIGNNAFVQGTWSAARDYWERALAVLRDVGEPIGVAGSLNNLGTVATIMEDYKAAEAYYQESLTISQTIGAKRGIADTLSNLGTLAFRQEDYQAAEPYHRESFRLHQELDDGFVNASRAWLARSLLRQDRLKEAGDLLRDGINAHRKDDVLHKLALSLVAAELRWKRNELEAAAELAGLILSNPSIDSESRMYAEKLLDDLRPHLDTSTLEAALERGRSLSLDETVARLVAELG